MGLVQPQLQGKFHGFTLRVPITNASLMKLIFTAYCPNTKDEDNSLMMALRTARWVCRTSTMAHTLSSCDATQTRVDEIEQVNM